MTSGAFFQRPAPPNSHRGGFSVALSSPRSDGRAANWVGAGRPTTVSRPSSSCTDTTRTQGAALRHGAGGPSLGVAIRNPSNRTALRVCPTERFTRKPQPGSFITLYRNGGNRPGPPPAGDQARSPGAPGLHANVDVQLGARPCRGRQLHDIRTSLPEGHHHTGRPTYGSPGGVVPIHGTDHFGDEDAFL